MTAEKVDHDLHSILSQGRKWKTREKLMVAISPSPSSQQLIRAPEEMPLSKMLLGLPCYVDTGRRLTDTEQSRLTGYLNLAQELGAEVITTYDADIASALQRVAAQKNVTQLVLGRSSYSGWNLFHTGLAERLEQENQQLDLLILRQEKEKRKFFSLPSDITISNRWNEYLLAIAMVIGLSVLGYILQPWIGYKSVGFIFLLGILILSFLTNPGPIFLAALLSMLAWNYIFIPPVFAFSIQEADDIALSLIFFVTAMTIGVLSSRKHKQEALLKLREKKLLLLYEVESIIADSANLIQLRLNLPPKLRPFFQGKFDVLMKDKRQNRLAFR